MFTNEVNQKKKFIYIYIFRYNVNARIWLTIEILFFRC